MMRLLVLLGCSFALSACLVLPKQSATVQKPSWVVTNIDGKQSLIARAFSIMPDQSIAIVGQGSEASFVLKRDKNGAVQWYKRAETALMNLYASHSTQLGALIVAGDFPSPKTGVQQAYVMSLSSAGGIKWQAQYDYSDDMSIFAIDEMADRSLIFAGATYPAGTAEVFDASGDSFVMKSTARGTVEWVETIRLPHDDQVVDILVLPDQSILALINNVDEDQRNIGVRLVRINADDGSVLYNTRLATDNITEAAAMHISLTGSSVWIAGSVTVDADTDLSERIALVKVSLDAKVQRGFYDKDAVHSSAQDLDVLPDGSIAVVGADQAQGTLDELNALYLHFDSAGNVLERADFGADSSDYAEAIEVLPNGETLILATFNSTDLPRLVTISR